MPPRYDQLGVLEALYWGAMKSKDALDLRLAEYEVLISELERKAQSIELEMKEFFELARMRNIVEAKRLGLKYFRYGGVTYDSTGAFCKARCGKIFTIDDILDWEYAEDRPVLQPYDAIRDCGGPVCFPGESHCNHTFRFVTDAMGEMLLQEQHMLRGSGF
jgi:hypothetical protein